MGASWEPTPPPPPPPPPLLQQLHPPSSSSSISVPSHTILVVVVAGVISLVALLFCMIVAKSCGKGCKEAAEEVVNKPDPPKPAPAPAPAPAPKDTMIWVPSCRCSSSMYYNSFHCNFCGACCQAACHCSNRFTC